MSDALTNEDLDALNALEWHPSVRHRCKVELGKDTGLVDLWLQGEDKAMQVHVVEVTDTYVQFYNPKNKHRSWRPWCFIRSIVSKE